MKLFLVNLIAISVAMAMAEVPSKSGSTKIDNSSTTPSVITSTTMEPTSDAPTSTSTTTTSEPTTSTVPPVSNPTLGNFTLMKGDDVCAYAIMKITVVQNSTHYPFINTSLEKSKSDCSNTSVSMWIDSQDDYELLIVIKKDESKFFVSELRVNLANRTMIKEEKLVEFPTPLSNFYNCSSPFEVALGDGNAQVIFSDMSYQAFQQTKTVEFVGKEHGCVSNYRSDVVIIAIGCALALLVVVILIAYLVARRKSRQRGYQSV